MPSWTAISTRSSRPTWRGAWGVQKPPPEIVVVDYDAGNLRSVQRALEHVGLQARVTSDPLEVARAEALVLPGVGSAQDCMRKLRSRGLVEPLQDYAASGRPFLGVCVGLQLLFDGSEEGGGVPCLGILPGTVRRFPSDTGLKVPQIGWNDVTFKFDHPLLADIRGGRCVRLVQGDFFREKSYANDPVEMARHWEAEGAQRLHVVDLDGARG